MMSRKITRILALLLALSMTYSIAGCSKIEDFFDLGGSSRSERRRDRDDDDADETEETEETDPTETLIITDPTEPSQTDPAIVTTMADLTYPDHIATYEEIHPAHAPGTVSGQQAVDLLNDIEREVIIDTFENNYVYSSIFFSNPEDFGLEFNEDNIGWGEVDTEVYEDIEELVEIVNELYTIDRDSLGTDDRIFYDKLLYDMELSLYASQYSAFYYYESVLKDITGPQSEVLFVLDVLEFETVEDAENYILVLRDIDRYYDALCAFEERRVDYGFVNSDDVYESVAVSFDNLVAQSEDCFLYDSFRERLNNIPGLSSAERDALIEEHDQVMHDIVFPEFQECADRIRALKCGAPSVGVCSYPGGDAYYAFIFATQTNTGKSIDQCIEELEAYSDSVRNTMMSIATSGDTTWLDEYLDHDYSQGDTQDNLDYLYDEIQADFPPIPDHEYRLMTVPEVFADSFSAAAFLGYHLDRYDSNIIITNEQQIRPTHGTVCAHEGYPGHMYESVYHRSITDHPYMYLADSIGYTEGWANYVQFYSYRYFSTSTAATLVSIEDQINTILFARFDIGINYEGWTAQDCANWVSSLLGQVVRPADIMDAYNLLLVDPGYGAKYGIGYLNTGMIIAQLQDEFPDASMLDIHTAYLNAQAGTYEQIIENARMFLENEEFIYPVDSWGDEFEGNPFSSGYGSGFGGGSSSGGSSSGGGLLPGH